MIRAAGAKTRTPTPNRFDCLVAGDANADVLMEGETALREGREILARRMNLVLGGSSAITAFNLSRMGAKVAFAGILGGDWLGQFVVERLRAARVDVSALRFFKSRQTGLTVWLTKAGARAGVTYAGTVASLRAAHLNDGLLRQARHLHVGAYFLQTGLHAGAARLFRRARLLGLTTSLDCNDDPTQHWDSGIFDVLRHTDCFFPNEDEALRLANCASLEQAARELAALARIVVVKQGARGVLVRDSSACFRVPALKVRVVDTTGAGDSFNAGFLSRFLRGARLRECARAGVAAGSRCVSSAGGTGAFEGGL